MPWYHDNEKNHLLCISEKHNRNLTIDLNNPPRNCEECFRRCFFWRHANNTVTIMFKTQRDQELN